MLVSTSICCSSSNFPIVNANNACHDHFKDVHRGITASRNDRSASQSMEAPKQSKDSRASSTIVVKTIAELKEPKASFPPRICLNAVHVVAVGKVVVDDGAKGKGKGKKGTQGGKGKGKVGTSKAMQKVSLHVVDPDTNEMMFLVWQGEDISVRNLANALINITSAKPAITKDGVHLELDERSGISITLNRVDSPMHIKDDIKLWTLSEATSEELGTYVNVALYVEAAQEKTTSAGEQFMTLNVVDTKSERTTLQAYGYREDDIVFGATIIAFGLAVRPGRTYNGGSWQDDATWGTVKFSAWRTAFTDARALNF